MTDYQLEKFCERNPDCGCNCMKCPAFISNMRYEMGWDEDGDRYREDDDED